MAIKDGRILAVVSDGKDKQAAENLQSLAGSRTRKINAAGRLILPGFQDCHIHLEEGAVELSQCRLNSAKQPADVLTSLRRYSLNHPGNTGKGNKWIIAAGLPLPTVLAAEKAGIKVDHNFLDQAVADRPLIIYSEDAHTCWLNSKAIKAAKITAASQAPCHGLLELDSKGAPSGRLQEGAMSLAAKAVPSPPLKERLQALQKAVALANSFGITAIQDAHATDEVLSTYKALATKKQLNLKICAALHTGTLKNKAHYARLERQRRQYSYGRLRVIAAKIFADGVVETGTAALLSRYINEPKALGNLNYSQEELAAMIGELDRRHFQIHVHAIGDRAVKLTLNSLEQAMLKNTAWPRRHHIAHLELVDATDLERFSALGVTANCQCLWAFQDPYIKELTIPRLEEDRTSRVYPFASLAAAGARLCAGSDWTVSSMNPLEAMQVAVTRQPADGSDETPLNQQEALSLEQIVRAYTTGGAWINYQEESTGSLEAGKAADFIMLDKNIFNLPPKEISQARVLCTVLDGREVFGSLEPQ